MKRIALLCAAVLFCLSASAAESLPGLSHPGRFIVGLDDTFAPMGFRDTDNKLIGFDIDLAVAVGKQLGIEVVFQPIDWDAKEMELSTGNIDCIWNGMSRTPEREKNMTLAQDYLNNRIIIMANEGVEINGMEDLAGLQLGTQAGSAALEAIKAHSIYPDLSNLHEYRTYDECIMDMQAGRIDAMIVDEVLGNYKNANLKSSFVTAPVDFGNDYYTIGFRRSADNAANEALVKAVENAIKAVAASGEGEAISKKWFGKNLLLQMK